MSPKAFPLHGLGEDSAWSSADAGASSVLHQQLPWRAVSSDKLGPNLLENWFKKDAWLFNI